MPEYSKLFDPNKKIESEKKIVVSRVFNMRVVLIVLVHKEPKDRSIRFGFQVDLFLFSIS